MVLSQALLGAAGQKNSYEKFSKALVEWMSADEGSQERSDALKKVQQSYKESSEYNRLRALADLEPQGLSAQMLGLEQEQAMKPKPMPKPPVVPAKPSAAPAQAKVGGDILSEYLPLAMVQRMSKEVKDDLTNWVVTELKPAGNDTATITALLKTDPNVKRLMAGAGAAAAAAAPKEKYPLVSKFVTDKKKLNDLTEDQKKKLNDLIKEEQAKGSDEGYIAYEVNYQLNLFAPQPSRKPAPSKSHMDTKHKQDVQGKVGAAASSQVTILNARTQGDGKHPWDCTWESINNATNIYNTLKKTKVAPQDLSQAAYVKGIPTISEAEIQPSSDEMVKVIDANNLIPKADYTFIEAEGGILNPDFMDLSEAKKLKRTPGAAHAFIVNTGGHWYTVVAHNKAGVIHYYIANDIPKKDGIKGYKEIIDFLKKEIE